jgi:hypothetical protein
MTSCSRMYTGSEFAPHESEQTSYPGASLRKCLLNRCYERRQITAFFAGALSTGAIKPACNRKLEYFAKLVWFSVIGFHTCILRWLPNCVRFSIRTMDIVYGSQSFARQVFRRVAKYRPLKGLSCIMGNYHVRFLGGSGP